MRIGGFRSVGRGRGGSVWAWRTEKRVKEGIVREKDRGESVIIARTRQDEKTKKGHASNRAPAAERQNEKSKTGSERPLAESIVSEKHTHKTVTRVEIRVSSAIVRRHRRVCWSGRHLVVRLLIWNLMAGVAVVVVVAIPYPTFKGRRSTIQGREDVEPKAMGGVV